MMGGELHKATSNRRCNVRGDVERAVQMEDFLDQEEERGLLAVPKWRCEGLVSVRLLRVAEQRGGGDDPLAPMSRACEAQVEGGRGWTNKKGIPATSSQLQKSGVFVYSVPSSRERSDSSRKKKQGKKKSDRPIRTGWEKKIKESPQRPRSARRPKAASGIKTGQAQKHGRDP